MKGYYKSIEEHVKELPEGFIFEAARLYRDQFPEISETSYYKTLERLAKKGQISHYSKGVYAVPKRSDFGIVPVSEKEVVDYYTRDNNGVVVGYRLFTQKGITTQISKSVDVISSVIDGNSKSVNNVRIKKAGVELNAKTIPIIEALEILQNYHTIEDANNRALYNYMKLFSKDYSDRETITLLSKVKYKKSTIAFLKNFLDALEVPNSLSLLLSSLSKYAVPNKEEINEFA